MNKCSSCSNKTISKPKYYKVIYNTLFIFLPVMIILWATLNQFFI